MMPPHLDPVGPSKIVLPRHPRPFPSILAGVNSARLHSASARAHTNFPSHRWITLQDGVYHVHFLGPLGEGWGTVSVDKSRVHGGDTAYYYIGAIREESGLLKIEVQVTRHPRAPAIGSVFGPLQTARLELQGSGMGTSFSVKGAIAGSSAQLQVSGTLSSKLDILGDGR